MFVGEDRLSYICAGGGSASIAHILLDIFISRDTAATQQSSVSASAKLSSRAIQVPCLRIKDSTEAQSERDQGCGDHNG